jgi:ferredoxin-NADP reductase
MLLRIKSIELLAEDIRGYELVDPEGKELPVFTAGSHIDIHLTDALVRQYSLSNDPAERHRYQIAVLREPTGRGGSQHVHDRLKVDDLVRVEGPRNNFALVDTAKRHLLIAGGIGVTPMMAMVSALEARSEAFHLHYCTRTPTKTAFLQELASLASRGKVTHHFDNSDPAQGLDLRKLLSGIDDGTHLYYCGPPGFMQAIKEASSHWPAGTVHFEYFAAPADAPPLTTEGDRPFRVRIKSSGVEYEIPVGATIVGVLRQHGFSVQTSCEEGYCGTCITPYLEGVPDHRDESLDDEARGQYVLICCARSKSDVLVLDL